jgi:short-subunit dehydrogenase
MKADLHNTTALITGASSGLGADFARQLAERGCNLVLTARRADRLQALQAEITAQHKVTVECISLDLLEPGAPQRLFDQLQAQGKSVDVLINNAGRGLFGEFIDSPWDSLHLMLEIDMVALTHLTHLFLPAMAARRRGYVLWVASVGAFQPTPTYAAYSAAKSYVLSFGEALHYELRHSGVHCTVLCPGVTRTEFLDVTGQRTTFYQRLTMMESERVVRIGIEALLKNRSSVVAGWFNTLMAFGTRFFPRQFNTAVAGLFMREPGNK